MDHKAIFTGRPFGFGLCEELNVPFVCQVVPGSQAERLGVRVGMQVRTVNGVNVSKDPPAFVRHALSQPQFPMKLTLRLDVDAILAQGTCGCAYWDSIVVAFRQMKSHSKRPKETKKSIDKKSQTPSDAEHMVVLQCEGLPLYDKCSPSKTLCGRLGFGTIILAKPESKKYIRIFKPYEGYGLIRKSPPNVGSHKDFKTIEAVLDGSTLSRKEPFGSQIHQTLTEHVTYWDTVHRHLFFLMRNFGITEGDTRIVAQYLQETPDSMQIREFPKEIVTKILRVVIFQSESIPPSTIQPFLNIIAKPAKDGILDASVVTVQSNDKPETKTRIKEGIRYISQTEAEVSKFSVHRINNGKEILHMCVVDPQGIVLVNTWPQTRLLSDTLRSSENT